MSETSRIGSRELRDGIKALLPADVMLPLRAADASHDRYEVGAILDANGSVVATVDYDRKRPDEEAFNLAHAIVLAFNAAAGHDTEANGWAADEGG